MTQQRASPVARQKIGPIGWLYRLAVSPSNALLMHITTIGYYTLAAYANLLDPDGSTLTIAIRGASLAIMLLAFFMVRRWRNPLPPGVLPGLLFLALFTARTFENMLFQNVVIAPSNETAILIMVVSTIVPAIVLCTMARLLDERALRILMPAFAIAFAIGMLLNLNNMEKAVEGRLALDKINPISLAYTASSFMLYYMLQAQKSKFSKIEAGVLVPILLGLALQAQSRGMLIATAITVLVYFLCLRGTKKIFFGVIAVVVGSVLVLTMNPDYLDKAVQALSRIDATTDMSTASRATSFTGAWKQFLEDPLIGRYVLEQETNYYPHNIYLEALMAVGIVGTLPFAFHLKNAASSAISLLRDPDSSVWPKLLALLFIRDAIGAAASGSLMGSSSFWITSFVIIAIWTERERVRRYYAQAAQARRSAGVPRHLGGQRI